MCKLLYFLLTQKHSHGRIDAVPLFPITKIFKSVSGTSPSKGSLYFLNVFWTTSEIFPDGQLNRNNLSYFARPPVLDTEENEIKPERSLSQNGQTANRGDNNSISRNPIQPSTHKKLYFLFPSGFRLDCIMLRISCPRRSYNISSIRISGVPCSGLNYN